MFPDSLLIVATARLAGFPCQNGLLGSRKGAVIQDAIV